MSSAVGAIIGAAVCVAASPYLAGLVRTVPDRDDTRWWRPVRPTPAATTRTAAVGALLGALAGAAAGTTATLPALLALALFGTPLVLIDLAHHRLPHRLTLPLAGLAAALFGLAAVVTKDGADLVRAVAAAAVVFAVLELMRRTSRGKFGAGDVNLAGIVGGYLGWSGWPQVAYGVFAGFVLGAAVSLALIATRRATLRTRIPFGPMLLLGALIVLAFDLVPTTSA